jgi:hypothetical protein
LIIPDNEPAEVSYQRQLRIAESIYQSLLRNLPGVDPQTARACANNIAAGYPELGLIE